MDMPSLHGKNSLEIILVIKEKLEIAMYYCLVGVNICFFRLDNQIIDTLWYDWLDFPLH